MFVDILEMRLLTFTRYIPVNRPWRTGLLIWIKRTRFGKVSFSEGRGIELWPQRRIKHIIASSKLHAALSYYCCSITITTITTITITAIK